MTRGRLLLVLLADVLAVLVLAVVGRASHAETVGPVGVFSTAAPFLAGVVIGYAVLRLVLTDREPARLAGGAVVWAATVVVGMVLRRTTGQGTAPSFVVVAAITLAILVVGWRGVYAVVSTRRRLRQAR